jgi:protein ImuA
MRVAYPFVMAEKISIPLLLCAAMGSAGEPVDSPVPYELEQNKNIGIDMPKSVHGIGTGSGRPALLAALRARISGIERLAPVAASAWTLGVPAIDARLPPHGLAPDAIHEIAAGAYADTPAAMGFAASLALRRLFMEESASRPLLWVRLCHANGEWGRLYGHGLARLGMPRDRLLTVSLRKPQSLLWTVEEALRSGSLALVIADTDRHAVDLTVTRRLSLAAKAGSTPAFLLFPHGLSGGTAALTRWCIRAHPSSPPFFDADAPGGPAWVLALERCRAGRPGVWSVEWHHATHRFSLVAPLSGGAVRPRQQASGPQPVEREKFAFRAGGGGT